jgi:multimeric flavodoxin WrbA
MKIVAVMGSPRGRGAGHEIVKKIEQTMAAMGEVRFEYIFLREVNLRPCTGCYVCMAHGEDECPLKDDRAAIEQKLLAAEGVILSSPMYVANVSWQMKVFLDRFAYTNHRPRFHRQKVLTVVNMAGGPGKEALRALRWAMGGRQIVRELAITTPPWPQTEREVARKERAIAAAAQAFYRACADDSLPRPTFARHVDFLMMQRLSRECRQELPADHEFYKGKSYYYATAMNPIKALAARAIVWVAMGLWTSRMGPGPVSWPAPRRDARRRGSEPRSAPVEGVPVAAGVDGPSASPHRS